MTKFRKTEDEIRIFSIGTFGCTRKAPILTTLDSTTYFHQANEGGI